MISSRVVTSPLKRLPSTESGVDHPLGLPFHFLRTETSHLQENSLSMPSVGQLYQRCRVWCITCVARCWISVDSPSRPNLRTLIGSLVGVRRCPRRARSLPGRESKFEFVPSDGRHCLDYFSEFWPLKQDKWGGDRKEFGARYILKWTRVTIIRILFSGQIPLLVRTVYIA